MLGFTSLLTTLATEGFFGTLNSFGQTVLTIIALTSFAGVGLMRSRISNLNSTCEELRKEIEDKDRRDKTKDEKIEKLERADIEKTNKIASLAGLVQGAPNWQVISDKLDRHHDEAIIHWNRDEDLLTEIRDELKARK